MSTDKRRLTQRWAVETTNALGTVRYMETFQRGVADAICQRINTAFAASGSSTTARVVPAGKFLIGELEDR